MLQGQGYVKQNPLMLLFSDTDSNQKQIWLSYPEVWVKIRCCCWSLFWYNIKDNSVSLLVGHPTIHNLDVAHHVVTLNEED